MFMKVGEKCINSLINVLDDGSKIDEEKTISSVAAKTLISLGEQVIDPLIDVIKDENNAWILRREAANILAVVCKETGNKKPLEVFINILKDKDSVLRSEAIAGLGVIGGEKAYKILFETLNDSDEKVYLKANVALALGYIGRKESLDSLADLLDAFKYEENKEAVVLKNNVIWAIWNIANYDKVNADKTVEELPDVPKDRFYANPEVM